MTKVKMCLGIVSFILQCRGSKMLKLMFLVKVSIACIFIKLRLKHQKI